MIVSAIFTRIRIKFEPSFNVINQTDKIKDKRFSFDKNSTISYSFKSRPASLPAPKQHTWTSEELQKFIFRPSDLMIPPKVLISYLKLDNDVVHTNLILKLVNTLEVHEEVRLHLDLLDVNS